MKPKFSIQNFSLLEIHKNHTKMTASVTIEGQINENFRNSFVDEVLTAHNGYRKRHGVPSLELDQRLSKQSQECAEDLLLTENIRSSRFPTVGENVYVISTNDPDYVPKGEHAVDEWYQQKENITIGEEPANNNGVNFSQMIWKMTQLLGVGIARNSEKIVIVCQYSPPGNIYGEYVENVLPEVDVEVEVEVERPPQTAIEV